MLLDEVNGFSELARKRTIQVNLHKDLPEQVQLARKSGPCMLTQVDLAVQVQLA